MLAPYRNRPLLRERGAGGERVVRSAVYATPNRGFARRLLNHASLCASALATAPASGPADVVVVESPPLFLAAAGVAYAAAKRAPLVLNVADRWPASAVELGALDDRARDRAPPRRWSAGLPPRGRRSPCRRRASTRDARRRCPRRRARRARSRPRSTPARFAAVRRRPADGAAAGALRRHRRARPRDRRRCSRRRGSPGPDVVAGDDRGRRRRGRPRSRAGAPANVRALGVVPADAVPALYARADAGVVLLRDRPDLRRRAADEAARVHGRRAGRRCSRRAARRRRWSSARAPGSPSRPRTRGARGRVRRPARRPGAAGARSARAGARGRARGFDRAASVRAWAGAARATSRAQRARR